MTTLMKAKDQADMVTLSLCNYGVTPCTSMISGRYLEEGFAVILAIDLERPVVIGSTHEDYSWRKFASILCTITDGFITPGSYGSVKVTGVDRIRADLLVLSWSYPEIHQDIVDWLLGQSDDSLDYLHQQVGSLLDEQNLGIVGEISELFLEVYGGSDLLSVFSETSSLVSIMELLERKSYDLKLRELEHKTNMIKPYLSKILKVIDCYGDDYQPKVNVFRGPSKTVILRRWMENYIESNGKFPEGEHSVVIVGQWRKKYDLGMIDFSVE